ncbi:MAG: gamma-glutamylcyclotransferase family protein [Sediminibacterium sp.]
MMEQSGDQLFVYGSLRSGFHHPAYEYISRYFTLVSEAKAKGNLYDMGEYPAAVPSEQEVFIIGELYRVNNPEELDWAIAQLDDYEGVHTENGDAPLYRREQTLVYTKDGRQAEAWIYWFNGDTAGKPNIESGDILLYMQQKNKS